MFLFLLSRLCSNNCLHKLSEYMYSSFPYWTNKFTLEKAFLQIAFGERKKKKGNVGLEFVAASNKFQNNERITLKTFDAWNALFALKREKLVPWVPRGLYQEKKNAWDDGTFSYHRKLCLMTKFSFKRSNDSYNIQNEDVLILCCEYLQLGNLSVKWFLLPLKYFYWPIEKAKHH